MVDVAVVLVVAATPPSSHTHWVGHTHGVRVGPQPGWRSGHPHGQCGRKPPLVSISASRRANLSLERIHRDYLDRLLMEFPHASTVERVTVGLALLPLVLPPRLTTIAFLPGLLVLSAGLHLQRKTYRVTEDRPQIEQKSAPKW